jgi:hypothetical protein
MSEQKYWYQTTIYCCPVCGHEDSYKERVYQKPKQKTMFIEVYDYCQEDYRDWISGG